MDDEERKLDAMRTVEDAVRIRRLEEAVERADLDVDHLLEDYKKRYPRPYWQLVNDIQRQAMVHYNIIEQLKAGHSPESIRQTFGEGSNGAPAPPGGYHLQLVPNDYLPNPNAPALLDRAFTKIARYRDALVDIVRRYGGALLEELSFAVGLTVTVAVDVGFPPSITIGVEHTAEASLRWPSTTLSPAPS